MPMANRLPKSVRICTAIAAFITLAGMQGLALAAPKAEDLVKPELIANVESIKPGDPLLVGVRLKIEPNWHVYWKNPGESGAPTRVKFELPDGVYARDLQFPIPKHFDQGGVIGYGYGDEVMLIAPVLTPANLPTDKALEIQADLSYLVCESVCLPGKATLNLSIPVKDSTKPANDEVFNQWRVRMPGRADRSDAVKTAGLSKTSPREAIVTWQKPAKDVQWFPVPPASSGVENIQTAMKGDVSTISFALAPEIEKPEPMTFLVAYTDERGTQRGVEFTVNLQPPQK